MLAVQSAPWDAVLSQPQYMLVSYFLVVGALAMVAGFIRAWITRSEVGSRYRPATVARLCLTAISSVTYLALLGCFVFGYDQTSAGYVPNELAVNLFALRFMEWTVTVPLLVVEFVAVCALVGSEARGSRYLAMGAAVLMIFTGYLGAIVLQGGEDPVMFLLCAAFSAAFGTMLLVVLVRAMKLSVPLLTPAAGALLAKATVLLVAGWCVYPLVYGIQVFGFGGAFTTAIQVGLCVADIVLKIGFGGLIHNVAKLRTAEDVRAGVDVHGESIWISSVKQSDAGTAPEVYLAKGAVVHERRRRPAQVSAVAVDEAPPTDF